VQTVASLARSRTQPKGAMSPRDGDQVAASKLAIDGEIEERQIPIGARHLKSCSDTPDLTRLQRRLLADDTAPSAAALRNHSARREHA
jgi:hypothetical protein